MKKIDSAEFVWEEKPNYQEAKDVFLNAYIKCYGDLPLEKLGKNSKEELVNWLIETFDETYKHHQEDKMLHWLSAKVNDKIVAFITIDLTNEPNEIYLDKLAVDPAFQRKKIGKNIMLHIFDKYKNCKKFSLVTRWANEEAVNFYKYLGFSPSSFIQDGYDPAYYGGFEYTP